METRQEKDLAYWRAWKKTNSTQDLEALLKRLQPLIFREVVKWQSVVPSVALEAKAKLLTVEALRTYNPNMGAAIGTHVASRLRKVSRSVYPYQHVVRLPENKQLLYNSFNIATSNLHENLGREPTTTELADELGWSSKKVKDFQTSYGRRELVESEGANLDTVDSESMLVDFYYNDLPPKDKLLFEDITGYNGKRVLNNTELRRKHNLTQGQLSHKKRKFVDSIKRLQVGVV